MRRHLLISCLAATLSLATMSFAGQQGSNSPQGGQPSQSSVALKTQFTEALASNLPITSALKPTDLTRAKAAEGKMSAIYGKVFSVKELPTHKLLFVNFAKDYKTTVDVVLLSPQFSKFPDMKQLVGKSVIIQGPFVDYHGKPEIVLKSFNQITVAKSQ